MNRPLASILLLVLLAPSLAAQQAAAPVITSITPSTGPASGGTALLILGSGLSVPPNFACFAPCPTTVRFGDVEVVPREESSSRIVVITPPHPAGAVDITLQTGDGRKTTVTGGFSFTEPGEDAYERVLVPIYSPDPVPGTGGSRWKTEFTLRNNGDDFTSIAPWPCDPALVCPPVFPSSRGVLPGETISGLSPFLPPPAPSNPARLIYVRRGSDYSMNLRLSDVSRRSVNAGTEIPVVREGGFLTSTAQLLNVPLETESRLLLRIYDAALTESRFRVRIFFQNSTSTLPYIDQEVVARSPEAGAFRGQPAYAQFNGFYDPLALLVLPASLRIEVVPLTAGSQYWTMTSITGNESQHVTLVTPQ
jgi:hypothetical protein